MKNIVCLFVQVCSMLWSKAFLAGHNLNTVTHVTVGTNGHYGLMSFEDEMELCKDILSVSDCLIVTSEASKGVQIEIDFARMVGMEVVDLAEKYRSL